MPRESSTTAAVRREYERVKRLYHKVGKQAAGKRSQSQAQLAYAKVKREYHRLGKHLGRLTKLKTLS